MTKLIYCILSMLCTSGHKIYIRIVVNRSSIPINGHSKLYNVNKWKYNQRKSYILQMKMTMIFELNWMVQFKYSFLVLFTCKFNKFSTFGINFKIITTIYSSINSLSNRMITLYLKLGKSLIRVQKGGDRPLNLITNSWDLRIHHGWI